MEEIHTKLILKSCEDYGMQSGNNLILLKKERFVMRISHRPTVYLLDKHGRIVCTIVNNQLEYESENNQDRRYQNTRNGFVVEWSNDGSICTVTCTVRRRKFSIDCLKPPYRKRTLLIASLLFLICLIGVLVYNFTPNSTELIARGVFEFDDKYGEEIESVKFSEDSEWLKVGEDGISIEVFSNKSGIPEEVLHEIQNISIYVNFDGVREHTSDTLRLSEEAINKIQNALQHEYIGAGRDSFNIHVITPIQYLMAELKDELSNARTVDQKLGKYSVYVTKVESSEKAIDEILSEASTILLEKSDYATFLTYFKAYSDRPVYKDVENKLNGLNKAQEVAANELQLKNDANKKKAQLQSLDCTPQTLQAVKKWYDGLDVDSCQ